MRTIVLIVIAFIAGKLIAYLDYGVGFSVTFYGLLITLFIPLLASLIRYNYFKEKISNWVQQKEIISNDIQMSYFYKGPFRWRSSDVQVIFTIDGGNSDAKYWFLCGSWWCGCISSRVYIYKQENGGVINRIGSIE